MARWTDMLDTVCVQFLLVVQLDCTQPTCNNKDNNTTVKTFSISILASYASVGAYVAPYCPRPSALPMALPTAAQHPMRPAC